MKKYQEQVSSTTKVSATSIQKKLSGVRTKNRVTLITSESVDSLLDSILQIQEQYEQDKYY